MACAGKLTRLPEGTIILTEGEVNLDMYKIIDGHAEVYMGYKTEKETLIGIIGPQACFGEFGMLLKKPAIYTVVAYSEILLLRITADELGDFVSQNQKNIIDIMRNMANTMLTMRTQIDLLLNDLEEGRKLDEKEVHDIEKSIGTYTVLRNTDRTGKFHTLDMLRAGRY